MSLPQDLVCKCFRVGESEIRAVLVENKVAEVEQVSELCKAGRGCGRCHEQIEVLIAEAASSA